MENNFFSDFGAESGFNSKKGLCDSELVTKYESGEIDFEKVLGRA